MSFPVGTPRHRLRAEVARPDQDIDLARAALLVAVEEYSQLPIERYLGRLDLLAEEIRDRLNGETAELIVMQELVDHLFRRRGFTGNREAYYDPRNSFLNDVLDRGLGIPLSLGILTLEVGWRLDLPLVGVNFPGHFLVRWQGEEIRLLIDPFHGTASFEEEAQQILDRVYGGVVRMQDRFLREASRRDMLIRLLTNLKAIYLKVNDLPRALAAIERILLLRPTLRGEVRDRGMVLARLGRHVEALEHLEAYLTAAPDARDGEHVGEVVTRLRRRLYGPGAR
ncbi:MAG: tetratricopeptide repeat protein [Gemmatimonadetes bacterium]|nr:tetratricopeptide repeat protein [Gemmatimonadota bacterium]